MYKWKVLSQYDASESIRDRLLENRGIASSREKKLFLEPPPVSYWFQRLPKDLLRSLRDAREMIQECIRKEQALIIHGDYDADGVCAAAILYKTIREELGYEHVYAFIPNRFSHGYGLSDRSIDGALEMVGEEFKNKGVLFITVDCGITSVSEVARLKKLNHKVIITDHHQKPKDLPPADVLVWYDQVVGAVLSYLLSKVLGGQSKDHIALASIATITDLQPVLNFNRTLVKEGLEVLNHNPPLGIKNILAASGRSSGEITTYDLGWLVGPRLNATGRVEDAKYALELLLEQDRERSREMAWELNRVNTLRQDKTMEMFDLASDVEGKELPKIIISQHDDYHEGIIGLVASKLAQRYSRPAIVISTSEDIVKGSVRSISGIDIIDVLRQLDDGLFLSLGGHPMAAGFSMHKKDIQTLTDLLEKYAQENIEDENLVKTLEIDMAIPIGIIDENLLDEIEQLKPFGMGNRQPVFASENLDVAGVNFVGGQQQHLSLRLYDGEDFFKAIFFNYGDHFEKEISVGDKIDIAYTLKKNEYKDKVNIDLVVKDIKKN